MRTLPAGQYIQGKSLIHRLDARAKILCVFILIAAVIGSSSAWGYALMLVTIFVIILLSGLPIRCVVCSVQRMWLFFLVIFGMNALFFDNENALASWWIFHLSMQGIQQGLIVVINVALILILGNLLTSTTSATQITTALENLMKPLKFIGVPTEDAAMIISVAIAYIPVLIEETQVIKMAQTARGARFESRKLSERAISYIPLVVPIFIAAFRRADELSLAMEARGYRNAKNRTWRKSEPLVLQDYSSLAVCASVFLIQFLLLR
ncbi:MAG: energy-coupling factor transporter transmembrane protein EcfT [Ruminiclostridium sp.]|nr:energy-coupling factor transporter transmembrane protein EcfT [Ruminiclostridium sp.]